MQRRHLLVLAGLLSASVAAAEYFDPVLDPACRTVPDRTVKASAAYVWYPGQQQAWRQAAIRAASKARCTYVGYPGRFNAKADRTFFRNRTSGGSEVVTVGGRGRMAALLAKGTRPADWEASLDGKLWLPVEHDPACDSPARAPDVWCPQLVDIPSRARTPLSAQDWIEDFRYIELGSVSFVASGKGVLAFTPGESVEEAKNEDPVASEQKPVPDVPVDGADVRIVLPERAMRYLRIRVKEGAVTVKDVTLRAKMEKVDFAFSFSSDDPLLNRLFGAGLATVHSSMEYGFHIDGIKRDALPWSMDAMLSTLAANWCFDNRPVVRNDISIGVMPTAPAAADWGCVDYPLHAALGIEADYLRHHDLSVFTAMRDRLESQLALYESRQDENLFVAAPRSASFGFMPGWSRPQGPEQYGTPAYPQMLLYLNETIYARFYERLGETAPAERCRTKAAALKASILRCFWDPAQRAFVNGFREDGSRDGRVSHHTQYWAVLADLFPREHLDNLFDVVLPNLPHYATDVSYEKGYELLAYQKAGRADDFYRRFLLGAWKEWLDRGHTSFPEHFTVGASPREQLVFYGRPFGRSLCHGTNGMVPVLFVLRSALGFREGDRPSVCSFAPRFFGKATRYEAKLRVTEGEIAVVFERGKPAKVTAPAAVTVTVKD